MICYNHIIPPATLAKQKRKIHQKSPSCGQSPIVEIDGPPAAVHILRVSEAEEVLEHRRGFATDCVAASSSIALE